MKSILTLLSLMSCYTCYCQRSEISVWFNFDKYSLTTQTKEKLDSFVQTILPGENFTIVVKGYTDKLGTEEYNNKLALKRAGYVANYLRSKGVDTTRLNYVGKGDQLFSDTTRNWVRRKVTVEFERQLSNTYSFYGLLGTEVQSPNNYPITIMEYFNTESMLRNNVYAISIDEEILVTGGMINICEYIDNSDRQGNLTIKIPIKVDGVDTAMKVWNEARTADGQLRWTQSSLALNIESTGKYYVFKMPRSEAKTCRFINLDKKCEENCFVYVTTYKPFDFKNVFVGIGRPYLKFEAKRNDSTWVFSKERVSGVIDMDFSGIMTLGATDTTLTARLSNSVFTLDERQNEHYYICDTCFIKKTIIDPDIPPVEEKKKKRRRGFFQWIADLFRKNK